jgi:hypothetical protein
MIAIRAFSITMFTKTMNSMKKDTESIQYGAVRNVSISKAPSTMSNTLTNDIVVYAAQQMLLRACPYITAIKMDGSLGTQFHVPVPPWSWRWSGNPVGNPAGARRMHTQIYASPSTDHTTQQYGQLNQRTTHETRDTMHARHHDDE